MRFKHFGLLLCLAAAGCTAQAAPQPEDPMVWGRADCLTMTGDPLLTQEFELARSVCVNHANAAGVASTAGMPVGRGWGGAIASGISQGMTQAAVSNSTASACLGDRGYMLKPRSHHVSMCEAIHQQRADQERARLASLPKAPRTKPKPLTP